MLKNIGVEIRKVLAERGLSEAHLSRVTGINQVNLNRLLRANDMRASHLDKICEALGLSPSYFFGEEISTTKKPGVIYQVKNESERLADLEKEVRELAKQLKTLKKQ